MKAKKSKTEYLSYIEETPKHHGKISSAASIATKNARIRALKNGKYVTYLDGNKIIKEYPNGKKVALKVLDNSHVSITKDGVLRVPKR